VRLTVDVDELIVWRLSLASSREHVFALLDTDEGRERFWAVGSQGVDGGFELEFPGGLTTRVDVVEREPRGRLVLRYFGSDVELELVERDGGGCLLELRCRCDDPASWVEMHPGWVSWLLVLKAAADFGVDLRNGAPERAWPQRYVDQ
jgi:uncharacterized protein YndB with AHSA1/START domain